MSTKVANMTGKRVEQDRVVARNKLEGHLGTLASQGLRWLLVYRVILKGVFSLMILSIAAAATHQ